MITGATHYHKQLGILDNGRTNKGLVVCYLVRLRSMKGIGLKLCARYVGVVPCCSQDGYRAQELQHPIEKQQQHIIKHNFFFNNVNVQFKDKKKSKGLVALAKVFSCIGMIYRNRSVVSMGFISISYNNNHSCQTRFSWRGSVINN